MLRLLCLFLLAASFPFTMSFAGGQSQVSCAIQFSTTVSDGKHSPEEVIEAARECGYRAVILTDRDLMKWEYGLQPVAGIVKRTVEEPSVAGFGAKRYLALADELESRYPGMAVVCGLECGPHYFWEGSLLRKSLVLRNWHKHVLVFGLETEADIRGLPVAGKKGLDQYQDYGALPYQRLFDYVKEKNGLSFWAHPGAANEQEFQGIAVRTSEHTDDLLETRDYTGFCVFYEGYEKVGAPGRVWDKLLKEYCEGKRNAPVWAIGGASFDSRGGLRERLNDLRNVLIVERNGREEVLAALKRGRVYVIKGKESPVLRINEFSVSNEKGEKALSGDSITGKTQRLFFSLSCEDGKSLPAAVKVIKNGFVVETLKGGTPFESSFEDLFPQKGRGYYRLEVTCPGTIALTNPIFMEGGN